MATKGVLIGPNLHARQMRLLRWGEDRMGTDRHHRAATPMILAQPGWISVKNDSGGDRLRLDVLGIDGPITAPAPYAPPATPPVPVDPDTEKWLKDVAVVGVAATTSAYYRKYVVLMEAIADGATGSGIVAGVVNMMVNMEAEWHEGAQASGYGLISKPYGGARILWADEGTGEQWATVLLGAPGGHLWYLAELDAILNQGSSAAATLAVNGESVTVQDEFLGAGQSLGSGAAVGLTYDPLTDGFFVTQAAC